MVSSDLVPNVRVLILILFLILFPGVDCSKIGLRDLRGAVSYLGQDPVFFTGTLRKNLDFSDRCADNEIWAAIASCHCSEFLGSENAALYEEINAGSMFSIGVIQLFNLVRVVLEKRKVCMFLIIV